MILDTTNLSRTIKKHESVGTKRVSRSGDRKHIYFFLALQYPQYLCFIYITITSFSLMSISCIYFRFMRELNILRVTADYQSCDPSKIDDWLKELGKDFCGYSYQMLKSGVDRRTLRWLSDEHLLHDCYITNGIHRLKIMEGSKRRLFTGLKSWRALNVGYLQTSNHGGL